MAISERTKASIAAGGGRHYKGRGLGRLQAWKCVACGQENAGEFARGCVACGAGSPGVQVRKPGEKIPDGGAKVAGSRAELSTAGRDTRPAASGSGAVPSPLRGGGALRIPRPGAAVDYDEIERRVMRALDQRIGGGFSEVERTTLYNALTVYLGAWEDGLIEPDTGLNLEKTRELAAKVSPDEMTPLAAGEAETHGDTETETAPHRAPLYDDDAAGSSAFDPDATAGDPADPGRGEPDPDDEGGGAGDDERPAVVQRPGKPPQ